MKFLICHILRIENDKSERKKIMPKEKTFEEMNEMERLKYETAAELGLLDQLKKSGWKSLSASETGRLGGIMNRKIRKQKESQENTKGS
jgi:small acid-soluble spore protein F (minor alpha/beta-type SASP)